MPHFTVHWLRFLVSNGLNEFKPCFLKKFNESVFVGTVALWLAFVLGDIDLWCSCGQNTFALCPNPIPSLLPKIINKWQKKNLWPTGPF